MREWVESVNWHGVADIVRGGIDGVVWYVALYTGIGAVASSCLGG